MAAAQALDVQAPVAETADILQSAIRATQTKLVEVQKFELHQRQARLFAISGLFDDIKGTTQEQAIAQAFVKIDLGESIGLSPAEAMTGIDLIKGRVSISANIRAAKMKTAGYDWDILQLDEAGCRLRMKYKGRFIMREEIDEATGDVRMVPAIVSFTLDDAKKAALAGKDNYKNYARNMFFARAITNAQRWYAPEIFSLNILSTEESEDLPGLDPAEEEAARKAVEEMAHIDKMFAELGTTAPKIASIKAKHIGNNKDLISWLEGQIAKKRNDGSRKQEASSEGTAGPSKDAAAVAANSAAKTTEGPAVANSSAKAEEAQAKDQTEQSSGQLFAQQDAKLVTQAKPAPPPVDEIGW